MLTVPAMVVQSLERLEVAKSLAAVGELAMRVTEGFFRIETGDPSGFRCAAAMSRCVEPP